MKKILVIEDEYDLRENLIDLLTAEDFEVISAENGRVGVELALASLPNLIICDVMMPKLDGHGVLSQLRQTPTTALIPFIFLTAKGAVEDFRTGMKLGADDYLTKPFKQSELLEAIAVRLSKQTAIQQCQQETLQHLQHKIENLQKENLLKDDFLSAASHELRSPMTNISLAVHMLKNMAQDENQQRYINLLQTECRREINLLNDLLDLQRLEANTDRQTTIKKIYLLECLPAIIKPFELRAAERQQLLQVKITLDTPIIFFDFLDLQRVLNELLNNACKYTPPGGSICLSIQGQNPIQILVGNEAEIPIAELPYIFERFYRIRSLDRWQQGGTGLGLTLVKRLVERMGGAIDVSSGNGWTQFSIDIPLLEELDGIDNLV